jgi:hypothetical protein
LRFASAFAAALFFSVPASTLASSQEGASNKPAPMACEIGPIERFFAGVQWLVLGCDDGVSLVFVTGPDSPRDLSYYFVVFEKDGAYRVRGEGNGDRALTKPAYDAIIAMEEADLRALHAEASAVGASAGEPSGN